MNAMEEKLRADLARIFRAARSLQLAAAEEAAAIRLAMHHRDDHSLAAVYTTHLVELDTVQTLLAAIELFEAQHPAVAKVMQNRSA